MSNPVIETPDILSIGLSMLLIIGSVIAFGWLYSRMRISPGGPGNPIDIIATRGLGAKERLLLVQVGEQQLLLGVTATNVTTLHAFSEPVTASSADAIAEGFAMRLRTAISGVGK